MLSQTQRKDRPVIGIPSIVSLLSAAFAATSAASASTFYVVPPDTADHTPAAPYSSWDTAATNIQDAVDAASDGDEVVLANGRWIRDNSVKQIKHPPLVSITKGIHLHSASGVPQDCVVGASTGGTKNTNYWSPLLWVANPTAKVSGITFHNGTGTIDYPGIGARDGSVLSNLVISTAGATDNQNPRYFGPVDLREGSLLTHCVVSNCFSTRTFAGVNSLATANAVKAVDSTVENCLIVDNVVVCASRPNSTDLRFTTRFVYLMGASRMVNCTIARNDHITKYYNDDYQNQFTAYPVQADGASVVSNCIISASFNSAGTPLAFHPDSTAKVFRSLSDCEAISGTDGGILEAASVTFADLTAGDYRLGKGSKAYNAVGATDIPPGWAQGVDLDGRPRVVAGKLDLGCYEHDEICVGMVLMLR